jgi:hypothetical protein
MEIFLTFNLVGMLFVFALDASQKRRGRVEKAKR